MQTRTIGRRLAVAVVGAAIAVSLAVPAAFAHRQAAPKVVGNAKAGKVVFMANCAACHTLKAAGAVGTLGPNLDKAVLTQANLIKAITNGGASVMGAAAKKCTSHMQPYKGILKPTQIQDLSAFVYTSTHK